MCDDCFAPTSAPSGRKRPAHHLPSWAFFVGSIERRTPTRMSFFPCSHCGQRAVGKLAAIYANWFAEDDVRQAYRVRYCVPCLTELLVSLKNGQSSDSGLLTVCPSCGTDSSQNLSGIYLTIYPPKQPEREYALTTCGPCAELLHGRFDNEGDKLGDRGVGAAAPTSAPNSAWSEIPW